MTQLTWDEIGQRLYEAGVDRGVLYLSDDSGVAWNGLTSIEEDLSTIVSDPVYFDGVKINDSPIPGDFAAKLHAFTYPDEFLEYEGIIPTGDGFFVDAQNPKPFGLSFRTRVGNDIEGTDLGYRVHIVYNVTAVPDTKSYETQTSANAPMDFVWNLTAVPEAAIGYRPTAHVILDSRFLNPDVLTAIENILYGIDGYYGEKVYDGGHAGLPTVLDGGDVEGGFGDPPDGIFDGGDELTEELPIIDGGDAYSESIELPSTEFIMADPRLPSMSELVGLVTLFSPRLIIPNDISGLAVLLPDDSGDITQMGTPGIYTGLPGNRLIETTIPGLYELA